MSKSTRTITHYCLKIENTKKAKDLPISYLLDAFKALKNTKENKKVLDDKHTKRFHFLSDIKIKKDKYVYGYFKSAKYQHRPPLISKETLSERDNPKKLVEGESERTHFALGFEDNEAVLLLENKHGGVGITKFVKYLGQVIRHYHKQARLVFGLSVNGSFSDKVKDLDRVTSIDIYTPKKMVTDTFKDKNLVKGSMKEEVKFTLTSKRNRSIKSAVNPFYSKLTQSDNVTRMRVYGKSHNNTNILIDSDRLKDKDNLDVELDDNGQVVSYSILKDMLSLVEDIV